MLNLRTLDPFKHHKVTLEVRNRIVGGIPTDPDLIAGWIAANMKKVKKEEQEALAEKTLQDLPALTQEKAEGMWTTFKRDPKTKAVIIESRQIKAMIKECANITREFLTQKEREAQKAGSKKEAPPEEVEDLDEVEPEEVEVKKKGKKAAGNGKSRFTNLKSKMAERFFIDTDPILLLREGKPLMEPDGNEERAIHVVTAQGPRTALKRVDYVNSPCTIEFEIRYLDDGVVDEDLLHFLFKYGEWNGLGTDRSQGNGLFKLVSIEEI